MISLSTFDPPSTARRRRLDPTAAPWWLLAAGLLGADAAGAAEDDVPVKSLGIVTITGSRPTGLPTEIPTTLESIDRATLQQRVGALDAEDALRWFPSLLVRKRYPGDFNHAILSSRASGTGNSARSAVYADGVLLSNYLGNGVGGLSYPPRWGLVSPEEIERVDVMYGPFSAAYPGNSVGAVVVYTTRMPTRFEAHAQVAGQVQPFSLYGTERTYRSWQSSAGVGDRIGDWAWRIDLNRLDGQGQPLTFPNRLVSAGGVTAGATPVTGAIADRNINGTPWYLLGAATEYRTRQDLAKGRLAWDVTPTLRASYVLGVWTDRATTDPTSYLSDASGRPVYAGSVAIDGRGYGPLTAADWPSNRERSTHVMQGLGLKSHGGGVWDGELNASRYDYRSDRKRANGGTNVPPASLDGGPGTLTDGSGTGWWNLAAKATWRPPAAEGAHVVEFGAQRDDYRLAYRTSNLADWTSDDTGTLASEVRGRTRLQSLWAQDAWRLGERWKTVLGLRGEDWRAFDGATTFSATQALPYAERRERHVSPKLALSYEPATDWVVKGALGRAVRMPTVGELYGATTTVNALYVNDPNLRPERSWTGELSLERTGAFGTWRVTGFAEDTRDAIYAQTLLDPVANLNVTRVQNVGRIVTRGLELVGNGQDVLREAGLRGLDLSASLTYADSTIRANDGYVATPGDTLGKHQPNIPRWRATLVGTWRVDERWSLTAGARYSGTQYRTLNNADVNGATYQGVSPYFVVDTRVRWQFARQWAVAVGIDNLGNDRYWNFHPYPQRTYHADLRYDL